MSEKTANFIETVGPIARNEYLSREVWILPSVCIAQAALESGWDLNARSVFGIKGNGFTSTTSEFYDGHYVEIQDSFRDYPDLASSIVGYYDFLRDTITEDGLNVRYDRALNKSDFHEAVGGLINTYDYPYATDPDYIAKIIDIINDFNLTVYDAREEALTEVVETITSSEETQSQVTQTSTDTYTVQPNDCLSIIAQKFNVDMQTLADFNGIVDVSRIWAGDVLNIPGEVAQVQAQVQAPQQEESTDQRTAIVQPGDGFWSIAERELGDGNRMQEIADLNGLDINTTIYATNVLMIPNN